LKTFDIKEMREYRIGQVIWFEGKKYVVKDLQYGVPNLEQQEVVEFT